MITLSEISKLFISYGLTVNKDYDGKDYDCLLEKRFPDTDLFLNFLFKFNSITKRYEIGFVYCDSFRYITWFEFTTEDELRTKLKLNLMELKENILDFNKEYAEQPMESMCIESNERFIKHLDELIEKI